MSRIQRLAALLDEPLLVAGPPYVLGGQANVRYLTGLQSSNAAVLVEPDGSATLYTDFRYANRARALEGVEVVETARGLIPAIAELLRPAGSSSRSSTSRTRSTATLVDAGVDAVPSTGLVEGCAPSRTTTRSRGCAAAARFGRGLRRARARAVHGSKRARARLVDRAELPRGGRRGRLVRGGRRGRCDGCVAACRAR